MPKAQKMIFARLPDCFERPKACASLQNQSGSLAKEVMDVAMLCAPNIPDLLHKKPGTPFDMPGFRF
jgi:hypothetical protein